MITLEINEKKIQVPQGTMIISAADIANIYIPRFCYHKKLSIAANCRMCLVQIGSNKKPAPACATPVAEGMQVWTTSLTAVEAQKAVMELLLINHPLDCPICDQGGQCELQDLSIGYGTDYSRYGQPKRAVADQNLGPLIATNMTRCIHCTRCIRFGREVAGLPELGLTGRGEGSEVRTYVERAVVSVVSGNMIDVCPVGALTAKPSAFMARPWEIQQRPSIAPHDGLGSNIHFHIQNSKLIRVVPRENESVNEVWISDRDRFSYQGLQSKDRLTQPMIKREGKWETVEWFSAIESVVETLNKVSSKEGPDQIAGLISPNSTLEELYLFQKFLRSLNIKNIDHRLQQIDFRDQEYWPLFPSLGTGFAQLEHYSNIFLVGSDIHNDQPLLSIRLMKCLKKGGKLTAVHTHRSAQNSLFTEEHLVSNLSDYVENLLKENSIKNIKADSLILLGLSALKDNEASRLHSLARLLAEKTGAGLGYLPYGANSAGAWIAGCVPHRTTGLGAAEVGLNWKAAFEKKLKLYCLFNLEPEWDCALPHLSVSALKQAESVIAMSVFKSEALLDYADIILPITPFSETAGTFVNLQQDWQFFHDAQSPLGESRPGWKVLRAVGQFLKLKALNYSNLNEIQSVIKKELNSIVLKRKAEEPILPPAESGLLKIVSPLSLYRSDAIVRRAEALQRTSINELKATLHSETARLFKLDSAKKILIKQAHFSAKLSFEVVDRVAKGVLLLPAGFSETQFFNYHESVEIQPC